MLTPSTVFRADVSVKCPFCGGNISFGVEPEPFATHSFPLCKTYERLGALEFIQAVNEKLAN